MTTTPTALAHGTRNPTPFIDESGTHCLRVPLDDVGQHFALIEREDYDHIVQTLGWSAAWCLTGNGSGRRYVVVNPPLLPGRGRGLISVARLFTGVGAKQSVRYATRDTLDLRRSNLIIISASGRPRHDCAKWLTEAVQNRRARDTSPEPLERSLAGSSHSAEAGRPNNRSAHHRGPAEPAVQLPRISA